MLYNLVEGSVDVPSGSIGYVSFGHGERHLIMIQGLNVRDLKGAGASLALMYKMFSRNYRVWFFDRRATVAEGLTIFDLAEDIYHAMRALSIDSADILGVSQGGMIAMALALEHPECTRKMVLAVTAARANENIKKVVGGWVYHARKRDSISVFTSYWSSYFFCHISLTL